MFHKDNSKKLQLKNININFLYSRNYRYNKNRFSIGGAKQQELGNNRRFGKKPRKIERKSEGLDKSCEVHHLKFANRKKKEVVKVCLKKQKLIKLNCCCKVKLQISKNILIKRKSINN